MKDVKFSPEDIIMRLTHKLTEITVQLNAREDQVAELTSMLIKIRSVLDKEDKL